MRSLAGRFRLRLLLRAAGLARPACFYDISHPARLARPDPGPPVRRIWDRSPDGCGHRRTRMALVHECGQRVSARSVLKVMRRLGLCCRIRGKNPWKRYSSYRGTSCGPVPDLPHRHFRADRPFMKLGTDVTEFRVAGGKACLALVYDMASKEIVCQDASRHPDMAQQERMLARLARRLPGGAHPILHSDMGRRAGTPYGGSGCAAWGSPSP